ncbi:hypothetical protein [Salinisphaera orenii]|uniref:hypothetical protein n=1 Tax=Salinisphaera orenii TaxID=856731 RepID=UPI0013A66164
MNCSACRLVGCESQGGTLIAAISTRSVLDYSAMDISVLDSVRATTNNLARRRFAGLSCITPASGQGPVETPFQYIGRWVGCWRSSNVVD